MASASISVSFQALVVSGEAVRDLFVCQVSFVVDPQLR